MMTTPAEYRVDVWAHQAYVSDAPIRAARASLPPGAALDIIDGDLAAIAEDGEVLALEEICPDLLDLLKPKNAREALLGHLAEKPAPAAPWVPLPNLPIAPGSAKDAVDKVLQQRSVFNGGAEWS